MIIVILLAIIASVVLIVGAFVALGDVSALDQTPLGPWGVMEREPSRRRPLSAQERRWQTAMTRAGSEDVHWTTLVASLDALDAAAGAAPSAKTPAEAGGDRPAQPTELDRRYLDARISHLETHLANRQKDNE